MSFSKRLTLASEPAHFTHAGRTHAPNEGKAAMLSHPTDDPPSPQPLPPLFRALFLFLLLWWWWRQPIQPFDTIKVRLQTQDLPSAAVGNNPPKVKGAMACAVETVSKEGERLVLDNRQALNSRRVPPALPIKSSPPRARPVGRRAMQRYRGSGCGVAALSTTVVPCLPRLPNSERRECRVWYERRLPDRWQPT